MIDAAFTHEVFLDPSAKRKVHVRPAAEWLPAYGLRFWFAEWAIQPREPISATIKKRLEHSNFGFRRRTEEGAPLRSPSARPIPSNSLAQPSRKASNQVDEV